MPTRARLASRALLAAVAAIAAGALTAAVAPAAGAQPAAAPAVERPVPFDSAGRIPVLTPALAARLGLAAPAFPVRGPFAEARLFAAADSAGRAPADGPAVLSVSRPGGAVERYALGAAERAALAAAVARGLAAAGPGLRGDTALVVSEPAGRSLVRSQTGLGFLLYGPAAAGLVGDESGSLVAYFAGAGAAFATSLAVSRAQPVTRAQAAHSAGIATGVAAGAAGLTYVLTNTESGRAYAAAVLLGGVGGSVLGFRRAAGMTDAEAAASNAAALVGVATTAGVAGAFGAYAADDGRPTVGAGVAALAAGYALGPRYARTRRYRVTAGDVETVLPVALTGAAFGAAAGWGGGGDGRTRTIWATTTAGFVGGAVLADRLLVRRVDHTQSEGDLVQLGVGVGAGLGAALASSARANATAGLAATGLGALVGLGAAEALLRPAPDGGRRLRTALGPALGPAFGPAEGGAGTARRLRVSPAGLVLARAAAARGGRGTFPLATVTF